MEQEEWFAVIADQDIYYTDGPNTSKLEYRSGDVVSYGTVIDDTALIAKGLTKVSLGLRSSGPDFTTEIWDATIPGLRLMTTDELIASQGVVNG